MTIITTAILLVALAAGLWLLDRRNEKRMKKLSGASDLSSLHLRLEEALSKLDSLPRVEQRLFFLEGGMKALPAALKAVGTKIDRMFQEFEEKTLPPEAQQIGAQALSRIAQARLEMERLEQESFARFNNSVESGGRAGKQTPIVARDL